MEAFADRDNTVYAEMLTVFADLQAQQERLHELEAEMAAGDHAEELLEEYGQLQEAFEHAGGYDYEMRIQQTLEGLGLGKKHWDMPLNHLSGGQKTRALLARLLLEKPDLLMLDEPTNHLDIEAVEWLEHTLREWEGAVLIVSHDRYFLDNTVNTIWEMSRSGHRGLFRQLQRLPAAAPGALGVLRARLRRRKSPPAQRSGFHPAQLGARQHACPRAWAACAA